MTSNVLQFPAHRYSRYRLNGHHASELSALSSGLMMILQIAPDRSLVSVLGFSRASSNHEAIKYWINQHWSPAELKRLHKPLDTLSQSLLQYLNDHIQTY